MTIKKTAILTLLLISLFLIPVNAEESKEIETRILDLPEEIYAGEEYDFIIEVKNIGEFNATEIRGFIGSDLIPIEIKNKAIDIGFLEAKSSKQVHASLISTAMYGSPSIYVVIESYKLNKSRRYRGEDNFDLIEDKKDIEIREKQDPKKEKTPLFIASFLALIMLGIFIFSAYKAIR
ncbi:hypothetical protein KY358_04145 [Candidatus Woesearchaeota archaeon]|nr:hypothetical protein [Candidatus Woesearchaeota archaeon]